MNKNYYKVDLKKLVLLLTPSFLRKPVLISFLYSFLEPLEQVFYEFIIFRKEVDNKIRYNSQVCYLRAALNDYLDPQERRIKIIDPIMLTQKYIYTEKEINTEKDKKPVFLSKPFYILTEEEVHANFVVCIPKGLKYDDKLLKEVLDSYKLPTKTYRIKYI